MTSKEYLSQARHLDALINSRLREIDYWREMSTSISGCNYDDSPHSPNRPTDAHFVNCLDKVWETETDVERKLNQLISLREEINHQIDLLPNAEEQLLLRYRYLDNCSWDEISSMMNVSLRTVHRIHSTALQDFTVPD